MDHAITVSNVLWGGLGILAVVAGMWVMFVILNAIAEGWKH